MNSRKVTLSDIPSGKSCVIIKVNGHGGFRHRIIEMGFVRGQSVKVIKNAPLKDPIEYKVLDSYISLRRSEASQIEVVDISEYNNSEEDVFHGTISEEANQIIQQKIKTINVALVGNPNCGKTSFFNFATGLREKVGNYSGVTVKAKVGIFRHNGYTINLIDLPGTYSITEYSPEELYVRQYLTEEKPDIVLNIIDSSNLQRNLFLTTQLIDMNVKMVASINMFDELKSSGNKLDYKYLGKMLGFPFVPTTAYKGIGITEVIEAIIAVYENEKKVTKHIHINYGVTIENAIYKIKKELSVAKSLGDVYANRYLAIKLIEGEKFTLELVKGLENYDKIKKIVDKERQIIDNEYKADTESVIADAKYSFIRGALKETFVPNKHHKPNRAERIDNVLTNKWLGFPILLLFLWIMFQSTFTLGAYPQKWIELGIEHLGSWVQTMLPLGIVNDLVVNGIIAGVGGVIVFLPNILILFFFISLMEDTGYMARATFIMDKLMHMIGLHGRAFIPLLTGFGCSVPAIMATRTLENKKDRILTMLIIPFMSCSARLPVYLLIVSAFFTKNQGLILLSIYLIGVIVAIIVALVLKKTIFKKEAEQFVMELPPYRVATVRNTGIHMWEKSAQYLKKMGSVILVASVIIWALGYFPRENSATRIIDSKITELRKDTTVIESVKESKLLYLERERYIEQQEGSLIATLGKSVEPILRPLGFDWKMSVCILTGFAAKETVVSSMGVLYHSTKEVGDADNLILALRREKYSSGKKIGQPVFTPLVAFVFMIFILLYCPCVATVVACRKESNRKWAVFTVLYTTSIAWIISFAVYHIGLLF